jgi:hypothetical protein
MCGEALRPPARRRSADEQKFWSDIRVDGSGDDTNGRPGRLQSYSYSHSSVRRADGSVSGQTMGEYVDHAGRKKHSRERRVGDTRMLETTGERPGADRPMQSRELHNGDATEPRRSTVCGSSLPIGTPHCEGRGGQGAGAAT